MIAAVCDQIARHSGLGRSCRGCRDERDAADDVSVYDRMCWPAGRARDARCAIGAHRRELAAYLGRYEYATAAALARRAHAAAGAAAPGAPRRLKVYLLPGILGSQLGTAACRRRAARSAVDRSHRHRPRPAGRAALPRGRQRTRPPLQPLGAIVYSYLALKLRLSAAGFEVGAVRLRLARRCAASVRRSPSGCAADHADAAGAGRSQHGRTAGARGARAAGRRAGAERITRLIGSAPRTAVRSRRCRRCARPTRSSAGWRRSIAVHDAESLTRLAFRGFMSLYQLLPVAAAGTRSVRSGELAAPAARSPHAALLRARPRLRRPARAADAALRLDRRHRPAHRHRHRAARRAVSLPGQLGAATAPSRPRAPRCPGARSYSLRCEHSELPRNEQVAAALIDLLRRGRTRRLRDGVTRVTATAAT